MRELRGRGRTASLARQILLLQVLLLAGVVAAGIALAYTDARRDSEQLATDRALAVAVTVADSPLIDQALSEPDPATTLQPFAEAVRRDSGTDFVVVMSTDGVRYSHPNPANIGGRFLGTIAPAQQGRVVTEHYTGTLGPSIRAVVPVRRGGNVTALVGVGITTTKVDASVLASVPVLASTAGGLLAVGLCGALLINRRLERQTHGLGEAELDRMHEFYDAVLHAVREGVLLLDAEHRITLLNAEGALLLGLDPDVVGRPVGEVGLPPALVASLVGGSVGSDEIHLVGDRVLVVNSRRAGRSGQLLGSAVTLRDHTELQELAGELDTVRGMAESLRSQTHEAANRLHTVVSLIEMGRPEDAVDFAIHELETAQRLTDRVVDSIEHPVVAALLLGKTAQAAERGVTLHLSEDSYLHALALQPEHAVTLIGNLVDNALDAVTGTGLAAPGTGRRVEVAMRVDEDRFEVTVSDNGPGVPAGDRDSVLQRGWSTKPGGDGLGRGLGLALVAQTVRRYGGELRVEQSGLGGAAFVIDIRFAQPAVAGRTGTPC